MAYSQFTAAAAELFRETFEGVAPDRDYTYFVQGKESIFEAIDQLTPEQASRQMGMEVSSIAAHTDHVRYYIYLANCEVRGVEEESDWAGSWRNQTVDQATWDEIRAGLRTEYATMLGWLRNAEGDDDFDFGITVLAQVAHAAFHLGAIRQLLRLIVG